MPSSKIQLLCKNGHLLELERSTQNVDYRKHYDPAKFNQNYSCEICGEGRVWSNVVERSDFHANGYVKLEQFLIVDEQIRVETILDDGVYTTVTRKTHAVYRIPPKNTPRYCWVAFGDEVTYQEEETLL